MTGCFGLTGWDIVDCQPHSTCGGKNGIDRNEKVRWYPNNTAKVAFRTERPI